MEREGAINHFEALIEEEDLSDCELPIHESSISLHEFDHERYNHDQYNSNENVSNVCVDWRAEVMKITKMTAPLVSLKCIMLLSLET